MRRCCAAFFQWRRRRSVLDSGKETRKLDSLGKQAIDLEHYEYFLLCTGYQLSRQLMRARRSELVIRVLVYLERG